MQFQGQFQYMQFSETQEAQLFPGNVDFIKEFHSDGNDYI